ncbi:MAG: phospholipid carrier-dependent glycosyltransferase [Candidatus Omnitrophota bacterium]
MIQTGGERRCHICTLAVLIFMSIGVFAFIMNAPLSHDEHMYITAGRLAEAQVIYRDFAYLQMPYLPFIYAAFFKLTGTGYYLLAGRVLSSIFMFFSVLFIYLISYRVSRSLFVSLCMAALMVFNKIIIQTMGYSWNNIMPIAFTVAAFYVFMLSCTEKKIKSAWIFLSGILLSAAVGVKLFYAAVLPPFVVTSLIYPRSFNPGIRFKKCFLPLAAGILTGFLPVFYLMLKDMPAFMFDNVGYHNLTAVWKGVAEYSLSEVVIGKFRYAKTVMKEPAYVVLLTGALFAFFGAAGTVRKMQGNVRIVFPVYFFLSFLLAVSTLFVIFVPSPLQTQYFAVPVPFLIIFMVSAYDLVIGPNRIFWKGLLVYFVAVSMVFGGMKVVKSWQDIMPVDGWTGVNIHKISQNIRACLGPVNNGDRMATLSPIYALEGGIPVYEEFATGPFLYRVGDLMTEKQRKTYKGVSPESLGRFLCENPPKAVFTGFEGELDAPFVRYAEQNGYRKLPGDFGGGVLYIKEQIKK